MRARLGFATAIMNRSRVILIGELQSIDDEGFKVKARKALKSQFSEERAAVIVSHAEQQLRLLCTRGIWLDQSGIRAEDGIAEVLAKYEPGT